jgi:ATP-dependent RNA helicase RhlE
MTTMTFDELNLAEPILTAVREKGYEQPTPIQEQAIPVVFRGKDIFGIAQTGTGKTAAFAIPILQTLWEESLRKQQEQKQHEAAVPAEQPAEAAAESPSGRKKGRGRGNGRPKERRVIRALILTPTRELALQIEECFTDYGKHTGLRHTAIFGGVKQGPQTEKLRKGIDILIATPGRLLDLIGQGEVHLDSLTHFVLDEADRMLDMGFIPDIRRLLTKIPAKRQTLFFSATMPDPIVSLSRNILTDPVRVEVTPESSTVDTIDQCIYFVEKPEKKGLLVSVLKKEADKSVLIFSRTKHGADSISRTLKKAGIPSASIHGDKSQGQRQQAMSDFKSGKVKVMVATDIAARGIDIKELGMVINYDLPDVVETYVHRIGRTGRAGHTGTALTFCSQDDHMMVRDIQRLVGRPIHAVLHQGE